MDCTFQSGLANRPLLRRAGGTPGCLGLGPFARARRAGLPVGWSAGAHRDSGVEPGVTEILLLYHELLFQPQLWRYTTGIDAPTFDAVATPPDIMSKLSGDDWIAAWFKLLDEELALADKLEEEFIVQKKDLSDPGFDSGVSMSPGGPPNRQPGSPGPGKRPKPKTPRRPPGPP